MKTDSSLLSAVLDDEAVGLRAATREKVIRLARRRRRGRALRRGIATGVVLVCAGMLLRGWRPVTATAETGVVVVNSQPLTPGMLTRTEESAFTPVRSGFAGIALVESRPLDIAVVETRLAMPPIEYLNDRQLLAAFPGRRAALIEPGTERARLIFY